MGTNMFFWPQLNFWPQLDVWPQFNFWPQFIINDHQKKSLPCIFCCWRKQLSWSYQGALSIVPAWTFSKELAVTALSVSPEIIATVALHKRLLIAHNKVKARDNWRSQAFSGFLNLHWSYIGNIMNMLGHLWTTSFERDKSVTLR